MNNRAALFALPLLLFNFGIARAAPVLNLDTLQSRLTPAGYVSSPRDTAYQNGRSIPLAKINPRKLKCNVDYNSPGVQTIKIQFVDVNAPREIPTSEKDNVNFAGVDLVGSDVYPPYHQATLIRCIKSFDPNTPQAVDTKEIAAALGSNIKFDFKLLPKALPLLNFAVSNKSIHIRVNQNFTLKSALGLSHPAVTITNGVLNEDVMYGRSVDASDFDIIVLSNEDDDESPVKFAIGDELIIDPSPAFVTQYYDGHDQQSLGTSLSVFSPRLNRRFGLQFIRAAKSRISQGSVDDLRKAAGDVFTMNMQ